MRRDSVLSFVSIAKKAGKVASGEYQTEAALKSGDAHLVIISRDASSNTRRKFQNLCTLYRVPAYIYADREQLGTATGNEFIAVAAVTDAGLADAIREKLLMTVQERREEE